jgi:hypothetical protein
VLRCKQRPSARALPPRAIAPRARADQHPSCKSFGFNRLICSANSWRTAESVLNCRGCWLLAGQRKLESCIVSALALTQRPSLQGYCVSRQVSWLRVRWRQQCAVSCGGSSSLERHVQVCIADGLHRARDVSRPASMHMP